MNGNFISITPWKIIDQVNGPAGQDRFPLI